MQGYSVETKSSYRVEKAHKYFVLSCFFFSTFFFWSHIGKNIAPILNLVSPFLLFIIGNKYWKKPFHNIGHLGGFAIISIIISYLIVGGGVGSVLSNIGIVILICVFYNCYLTKNDVLLFIRLLTYFHLFLIGYIFIFRYNEGYIGSYNANSISNQALINMTFFILSPVKGRKKRIFLIVTSALIIFYGNSRTCIGACFLAGIIWIIRNIVMHKPNIVKLSFWLTVFLSIAIPFAYSLILGDVEQLQNISDASAEHFNKGIFTGREIIWASAWKQLIKTPENFLLGIGSHFDFDGREELGSNFHSSFFTVVICCGFLGLLFISFLLYKLFSKNIMYFSKNYPIALHKKMFYIPIMFAGVFESTLLIGNYAIMLCFMLCMINSLDCCNELNSYEIKGLSSK